MTCDQCGARVSEGDAFCGECGAFLDWSAPRPARPAEAPEPPQDPPAPAADAGTTEPAAPTAPAQPAEPTPATPPALPAPPAPTAPPAPPAPTAPTAPPAGTPGADPGGEPLAPPEFGAGSPHAPTAPTTPPPPAAPPAAPPSTPPASPDPTTATTADSAPEPGSETQPEARPETQPESESETQPESESETQPESESEPDTDDTAEARRDTAADRAAALLAPAPTGTPRRRTRPPERATPAQPAGPRDPAARPVAVPPGREAVRRPRVRPAADGYAETPDDVTCPECGTANPAGRSFCRRCGVPLRPTDAEPRLSWWRRLWRRLRGRRSRRRGPAGRFSRPLARLLLLAVVAGLVLAAIAYGPRLVDRVRERFATPRSVHPASVEASSAAADHAAELAVDGTWNRYWAPAADQGPAGQWLAASFEEEFRLTELVVHSGSSDRADEFLTQARPASLTVTAWNAEGEQVDERTVTLEDRPGEQVVDLTMDDVATLRLTIRTAYGQQPARLTALGEVEFFTRG